MAEIITSDWTTLSETEYMKATDTCHPCEGIIKKVYIDGSATTIGASCYAGCGPPMIRVSMEMEHCWVKNKAQTERKSEH
eukprot:6757156-Heterocapsa_arctica.AAC.2